MFSIGEFSKVTGLTVKTLRFYHQQSVLVPSHVDSGSGYRYYRESQLETARVICSLRRMEFTVAEIREILSNHDDDADLIQHLKSRRHAIRERMKKDRDIARLLDQVILHESEASKVMNRSDYDIETKSIDPILVASIRMVGKYSDCGKAFGTLGRHFGRYMCGKPLLLHHDKEYREEDANFEVCVPIKQGTSTEQITVQELPGGTCCSLMHLGPYDELGRSYEKLLKHIKSQSASYQMPTREVYHKGPGMIFKGNPKKYLTEIQFMVEPA